MFSCLLSTLSCCETWPSSLAPLRVAKGVVCQAHSSNTPVPGLSRSAPPSFQDAQLMLLPPGEVTAVSPHPLRILAGCSHQQLSLGLKVGAGAFYSCRCLWVSLLPPTHPPLPASSLNTGSGEHISELGCWRPVQLGLAWVLGGGKEEKTPDPTCSDWASWLSCAPGVGMSHGAPSTLLCSGTALSPNCALFITCPPFSLLSGIP